MTKADRLIRQTVGVDIGGANLKYCALSEEAVLSKESAGKKSLGLSLDTNELALSVKSASIRFPMWKRSESLAETLTRDLRRFHPVDALAVTMTGELADCFVDRSIGVQQIIDQVSDAASQRSIGEVAFYGVDGKFHSANDAKQIPDIIAAANWHALATLVARRFPTATTVIDVGSTTTDIIPLAAGRVATLAATDHERLVEGSLVYIGCRRTSVCSLLDHLRFWDQDCPVMNEAFATIDDARLLLKNRQEAPQDCDTSDGLPRTIECAANRIARMIGLDRRSVSIDQAVGLADQVVSAAAERIGKSIAKIHRPGLVIVSGHGNDLLRFGSGTPVESLADHLGETTSRCAPSYAVASLHCSKTAGVAVR